MEIGHKVSFIILVFWCFIIVLSSGFLLFYRLFFIFLSCILRPAFASVLSSARSTDYWGDMGEFSGMGRAGAVY